MDADVPAPDDLDFDEAEPSAVGGALTWAGALVGAVGAKKVLERVWVSVTGDEPPTNPAAPGTGWREALMWGAALGLAGGVARTVARRLTAGAAAKLTGEPAGKLG